MSVVDVLLLVLPYGLGFAWCLAICVYALKLVWPWWDDFTRFGKLEKETGVKILKISNEVGWCCFYLFSCVMFFVSLVISNPPSSVNCLLLLHSGRRYIESVFITNFSNRRMHIINFVAGLVFYIMTPVTLAYCSRTVEVSVFRTRLFSVVALILNVIQYQVHDHLASLKKYTIPRSFAFRFLTSPHYTAEIALYVCYFALAPHILTLLMLIFVAFNLTHQAIMTYRWYVARFGQEFTSMRRYILVPFIY